MIISNNLYLIHIKINLVLLYLRSGINIFILGTKLRQTLKLDEEQVVHYDPYNEYTDI